MTSDSNELDRVALLKMWPKWPGPTMDEEYPTIKTRGSIWYYTDYGWCPHFADEIEGEI